MAQHHQEQGGENSLEAIQEQNRGAEALATCPQRVGGPYIARAQVAKIEFKKSTGEQQTKRNTPQQIGA